MKSFLKLCLTVSIFLFSISLFSHNHWVYANNYFPGKGEKINFEIRSGHKFPKSGFLLKEVLIQDTFIKNENSTVPYTIKKGDKSWESNLTTNSTGCYTINFTLKKRSRKETLYRGKAIVFSGKNLLYKALKLIGDGLEIELSGYHYGTKAGDKFRIKIFYNSSQVQCNCTITREGDKPVYRNSNKEKIIEFTIKKTGLYLITANYKGKGSSLTFSVR